MTAIDNSITSRNFHCRRVKRLLIVAIWLLVGYSTSSLAQQASISGNVINLPVVVVGEQFYQVELTIVANTSPLEFNLTGGVEIFDANSAGASTFAGTTLSIPSLAVGDVSYWVDLALISDSPIRFRLANAGVNEPETVSAEARQLFETTISPNIVQSRCIACHLVCADFTKRGRS
jgi:hypothetical protein